MKIKSLEASGFKSFCDKTKIVFDNSLTAVVGPNGCGKSNVIDSIRWALGEQSAKTLRGSGMGDVIFNGSEKRKPQSLAEVTVTFDNTDGLSHPLYQDYPEIAITRRLHRDGGSEYLINKVPCRLKDITELFMGTGGGARAYSIIEQGRIGLIVSARSEDRRNMIEEAAGITRFKKARQTAQRKMEQTRQNLLRINDVVNEMARSLTNLKKQARKAERYNRYAAEQRDAQMHLASHRYLEMLAREKTARAIIDATRIKLETAREELQFHETKLEELKVGEATSRTELEAIKKSAMEANNRISLLETEIRHFEESLRRIRSEELEIEAQKLQFEQRLASSEEEKRVIKERMGALEDDAMSMTTMREEKERRAQEAKEQLAELGREFDSKRDRLSRARARIAASESAQSSMVHRIDDIASRLENTKQERSQILDKIRVHEESVTRLEAQYAEMETQRDTLRKLSRDKGEACESLNEQVELCDDELRRTRDELTTKSSRLNSLREVSDSMGRNDNAVKQAVDALKENDVDGFNGMFVDAVKCPEDLELALAVVLGDKLQSVLTANLDEAAQIMKWLKERDLGRIFAISEELPTVGDDARNVMAETGVEGSLLEFLDVDAKVENAVNNMLSGVFVVDSAQTAIALWKKYGATASYVTRCGQYMDRTGTMGGGRAGSAGADILQQKREMRELEFETRRLEEAKESLEHKFAHLKEELQRTLEVAQQARDDLQNTEFKLSEIDKDRQRAAEDFESAKQRSETVDREFKLQENQYNQLITDREVIEKEINAAKDEVHSLSRIIEENSELISACREEADRLAADVTEAKVREAQCVQQHHSAVERSAQIAVNEEEIGDGMARIERRKKALAKEVGYTAGKIFSCKIRLEENLDNTDSLNVNVEQLARVLDEKIQVVAEAETLVKQKRAVAEEVKESITAQQMDLQQVESDQKHLVDSIMETHDVELPKVLGDYHLRPIPDEALVRHIEELKSIISRMGSINPAAIEEYEETSKLHEEKVTQKEDIEQALEDLETAISRMDKDSRRMFKETFDAVNEAFQKIFPRLFRGGHARLQLTDPEDMLATGVDIIASPPGKKLGSIELMSGGEKALTAVSLLFAIFLLKPSPFCLLDEVDAPLDDANVFRMVEMLREMTDRTQFVIITHSKITMEGADALYGVTMQEPGISKVISVNLVRNREMVETAS